MLDKAEQSIVHVRINLAKLRNLKTSLMQDLLTGKVRVTPLMENMEAKQ